MNDRELLKMPASETTAYQDQDRVKELEAQRDTLLEMLRSTADLLQIWIDGAPPYDEAQNDRELLAKVRVAIAKSEGGAA